DIPMLVAKHLDFDVTRIRDELLDEDALVSEGGLRLRARAGKTLLHVRVAVGDAHALAAAARARLDHDGVADLVRNPDCLRLIFDHPEMAWNGRYLGRRRRLLRLDLVAHRGDRLRIRPDKDDAGGGQRFREGLALGKKTVARMHGLRPALLAGGNNLFDHQVTLGRRRWTDRDGTIRHPYMERILVHFRVDRDCLDSQFACGLDNPAGDFAAIGDQDTLEHSVSVAPAAGLFACAVVKSVSIGNCQTALPAGKSTCALLQYCLEAGVSSAASQQ